jgi:anti-sigma B factor antagonist
MNYQQLDDGRTMTLRVRGELDALSALELRPVVDALAEGEHQEIIVDLSELRLIDSSGIGILVSLYKRVRSHHGSVRFTGVTAQPLAIFRLLRLDVVFALNNDEGEFSPRVVPIPSTT